MVGPFLSTLCRTRYSKFKVDGIHLNVPRIIRYTAPPVDTLEAVVEIPSQQRTTI
jgi:hypothetical protein